MRGKFYLSILIHMILSAHSLLGKKVLTRFLPRCTSCFSTAPDTSSVIAAASSSSMQAQASFVPPPLHYSDLPEETIYVLDATSMLITSHFSKEVAADYAEVKTQFQSKPNDDLPCGALVGLAMVMHSFFFFFLLSLSL